ncbi:hypothetical protein [Simiduia aestuariiviva]|uniref:DUF4136 domain-containing protein n=1 Tax=Simiduia aestuariiviva TaxID=1510459 RepID=A0A839UJR5_9GAMM|nr:hypothetical protein [Simiduia aestuariiviva]MBB3166860.1 hypothetical protein [Simiduia aestuariiviva]
MQRILLLSLTLLVMACASAPKQSPAPTKTPQELSVFSVISVTDPDFKPRSGDAISWISDVIFVGDGETPEDVHATAAIKSDIGAVLTRKGYQLVEGMAVEYRVLALVQVGDEKLSEEMRELFRLYPSLGRDSQRHKGMLIVAIARPGSVEALWRGAIKVFVEDEHELTPAQQRTRIQQAVGKVMASLPRAN